MACQTGQSLASEIAGKAKRLGKACYERRLRGRARLGSLGRAGGQARSKVTNLETGTSKLKAEHTAY